MLKSKNIFIIIALIFILTMICGLTIFWLLKHPLTPIRINQKINQNSGATFNYKKDILLPQGLTIYQEPTTHSQKIAYTQLFPYTTSTALTFGPEDIVNDNKDIWIKVEFEQDKKIIVGWVFGSEIITIKTEKDASILTRQNNINDYIGLIIQAEKYDTQTFKYFGGRLIGSSKYAYNHYRLSTEEKYYNLIFLTKFIEANNQKAEIIFDVLQLPEEESSCFQYDCKKSSGESIPNIVIEFERMTNDYCVVKPTKIWSIDLINKKFILLSDIDNIKCYLQTDAEC